VRLPKVWLLPWGYKVKLEYRPASEMSSACTGASKSGPHGCWHDFVWKVGKAVIAIEAADEMLDSLFHEMVHALIDWHGRAIRPRQRDFLQALLKEAALQAAEKE
jgi:hypothetical protein